ncbi:MAG: hypothetical protein WC340_12760 [Kiritimatiellia bacterium]
MPLIERLWSLVPLIESGYYTCAAKKRWGNSKISRIGAGASM